MSRIIPCSYYTSSRDIYMYESDYEYSAVNLTRVHGANFVLNKLVSKTYLIVL